jgi:hypothetical protein
MLLHCGEILIEIDQNLPQESNKNKLKNNKQKRVNIKEIKLIFICSAQSL